MIKSPAGFSPALQVWRVALDSGETALEAAMGTLSSDERRWSERLRQAGHRRQFVLTRAALRQILGEALGVTAQAVELVADDHGKPHLALGGLHFNLSHSGDLAVIVVCRDHPVGIDVEKTGRSLDELDDIARTYFSVSEQAAYFALATITRGDAFYRAWTRKEAVAKALGLGMSLPGPSFDVTMAAGDARLLRLGDDAAPSPWSLIDLDLPSTYVGALAVQAISLSLVMRRIEDLPV